MVKYRQRTKNVSTEPSWLTSSYTFIGSICAVSSRLWEFSIRPLSKSIFVTQATAGICSSAGHHLLRLLHYYSLRATAEHVLLEDHCEKIDQGQKLITKFEGVPSTYASPTLLPSAFSLSTIMSSSASKATVARNDQDNVSSWLLSRNSGTNTYKGILRYSRVSSTPESRLFPPKPRTSVNTNPAWTTDLPVRDGPESILYVPLLMLLGSHNANLQSHEATFVHMLRMNAIGGNQW